MSALTFAHLKDGYSTLWRTMVVKPEKIPTIDRIANKLIAGKTRYQSIERKTSVPWTVVAIIHQMECGGDWSLNLAQGDPWNRVSTHDPKGRGPFTSWEAAAIDALSIDGTDKVAAWGIERLCYELEKYNGFGSRNQGINTPYLWSYSNQYTRGKYIADHDWDPNAISGQVGAMPLLLRMMAIDRTITLGTPTPLPPIPAPSVQAPPPASALTSFFTKLLSLFKRG